MHPEFALHHLLHNSAERDPERVAVVESQSEHTYGELERHSDALCAALVEEEVRKGERVGIYTEKPWEAAVAVLRPSRPGHSCGRRCITSAGEVAYRPLPLSGLIHLAGAESLLAGQVEVADHGLHAVALDLKNWSYTVGDGEAVFLHRIRVRL